jgi:ABC-2 type transport system ATP-binding protein
MSGVPGRLDAVRMRTSAVTAEPVEDPTLAENAVVVRGLTKKYRERTVLDGVTFDVAAGEVLGLLGPNGTGKTTTVEIVQGLRARDGGTVRVLGLDPARDRARLRSLVGAQLQSAALPERLRVGEALRLFTRLAGDVVDPAALAAEWGLDAWWRRAFGSLSGGERQRLFVALALVNRPRVVFLDELTQGLDPAAIRDTWHLVRRLRGSGVAVVLVTHDMTEAEHLCDRVAVLHRGQVRACGTPAELVARVTGTVRTRFTVRDGTALTGLDRLPGVQGLRHDGTQVEVHGDGSSPVHVAAELARRGVVPDDLVVQRPSLSDVFDAVVDGGLR